MTQPWHIGPQGCEDYGDNGESTWSKHYTFWTCQHPKGHKGKHSWEKEGRYNG